ncbi:conserved hypothetical protein [Hahella chejuensis KCTC 2396]|uniref:Porin domain-containing protein n=1 Tax=Hahella chejuensis (strain KCTC 2396) TaxID=349521 RepID=Q2S9F5_HAHCH|nr:hypothetical protein [Hahella chejuensis]ABC32719.1 conserved hypothetical protein [Hahella chejuensis KCTC 2396]
MKIKESCICLTLTTLYAANPVHAADDRIHINGFGSIVAATTFDDEKPYFLYDDDLNFKNESLLGLQVRGDMGDNLSATAQIIARGSEDHNAEFEWAYVTYAIDNTWTAKVGRFRTPFFEYSDTIDVGYAYHWVRPPQSVYVPLFNNLDGLNVTYASQIREFDSTLNFFYGSVREDIPIGQVDLKFVYGGSWRIGIDWISMRFSYFRSKLSIPAIVPGLDTILPPDGPGAPPPGPTVSEEAADAIRANDDRGTFGSVSLKVEYDNFFAVAEVTKSEIEDSIFPDPLGYYLSVGYTIDKFTPHITYEVFDTSPKREILDEVPESDPVYTTLEGMIESTHQDNKVITVGVRYDFHHSASLKFDFSKLNYDEDGPNRINTKIFSTAISFVF